MDITNSAILMNIEGVIQPLILCGVSFGAVTVFNSLMLIKQINAGQFEGGKDDFEMTFASKGHKIRKEKRKLNWLEERAFNL